MGAPWTIQKTLLQDILPFRSLFLQENNFQIRYDAQHRRGWSDSYLISWNGQAIGYGSIAGKNDHQDRDSIFEYYLLPHFRAAARDIFAGLIHISAATHLTCQTNDLFFSSVVYGFARNIRPEAYLFSDHHLTDFVLGKTVCRKRAEEETIPGYGLEQMGGYVVEQDGELVATGDFYLHYNPPFADLWMEVAEKHRRKGIGAFLLQELKKECYLAARIPAARCGIDNAASKACLLKAGLQVAGCLISGDI